MTYTGQNIEVYQGKDRIIEVNIYDSAGAPLDISGCTFTWVLYKSTPYALLLTKTNADGIAITDAANGVIQITLVPADTQDLLGDYKHEGEITTPLAKQDTIFTGYFKVYASKT